MSTIASDPPKLLRDKEFVKFWGSEALSQIGEQITPLGLQLTAVLVLNASTAQVGLINSASYASFLGLTLFIGVWVDRTRRKPLMVASNFGRVLLLASVPALAAFGGLQIGYIFVVALLIGTLSVIFDVSYQSYLPTIVQRDQLTEGNSKLQATSSIAQIGGPGAAGLLIQVVTAPFALLVNAFVYLASAFSLLSVRKPEPAPVVAQRRALLAEIRDGLKFTFGNRYLRACVLESGTYNFFWNSLQTVFVVYAARSLHLGAGGVGGVLSAGAVGSLVGSVVAARVQRRLGLGPATVFAMIICCVAPLLIPLLTGAHPATIALIIVAFALCGVGATMSNVYVISLRQAITPDTMMGKMNASYRFVSWGCLPLGALFGGFLGGAIGLRTTLFVTALGFVLATGWIVFSPMVRLRELPTGPTEELASPSG